MGITCTDKYIINLYSSAYKNIIKEMDIIIFFKNISQKYVLIIMGEL